MIAKPPPSRKTRTKLRKPKFASLRLHLTAPAPPPSPPMPTSTGEQKQLINLFPLHPENLVEQYNFCDDKAATTLTGILCSDASDDDEEGDRNRNRNGNNPSPSPASVNYDDGEVELELVRTAMRGKKGEWNGDDGKWVCYSEVVERKEAVGGMVPAASSSEGSCGCWYDDGGDRNRSKLVLKLDYEKIMKTWVNKGPFCSVGESGLDGPTPQIVPDGQDDVFNGTRHDEQDYGGNGGSWIVPELPHSENIGINRGDDTLQVGESSAMIHNREASVQRYKEKRRNRLFAKTIRYEVRKLNAEKRPRIKGRFVKRN